MLGRELAFQFAKRMKKTVPNAWNKNRIAGRDWFDGFMSCHPAVSMRRAEATSLARASAFNKANVKAFFDLYIEASQKIEFEPQNIWNVDETGLTTVHKPNRVISRRGARRVGQITSGERGTIVSMALAVNAAGGKAPPYLVFPRVRFQNYFLTGGPDQCNGGANQSGFINGDNFLEFIKHFHTFTKCTKENPILLLLDNHVSHRTLEVIKYCRENGIHMLSFPPHCSHRLQPLDVSVFGPWKKVANTLCEDWVKMHPGQAMTIYNMPEIFRKALETVSESNIKSGFGATGIWPLNRNKFTDIDFMPSKPTDRPYTPADVLLADDIPLGANIVLPLEEDDEDWAELRPMCDSPTTSSTEDLVNVLQAIRPYPQAPPRKEGSRGRKKGKTTILTSDDSFEVARAEREARDAKQLATEKRKEIRAAKKEAALLKKLTVTAKKAAKANEKRTVSAPQRASKRSKKNYALKRNNL